LILPGVVGAISLILALFAFNFLPLNWSGAALIALALTLFVMEATITSHGILAIGGVVAMSVGAMMLVDGPIPQLRIRSLTTLGVTIPVAAITVFLVRLVYLSRRQKSVSGEKAMVGERGAAITEIGNTGRVFVHGEYWNAFSRGSIPVGARVRVINVEGLRVEVEEDGDA
jgi:membrane-bound serine protease (ClpP class)